MEIVGLSLVGMLEAVALQLVDWTRCLVAPPLPLLIVFSVTRSDVSESVRSSQSTLLM